jgi:putative component of toxin-antitoxin plasmid stabilization module
VDVRVRLENLPRGSQVDARATGQGVNDPRLDVGFATLGAP